MCTTSSPVNGRSAPMAVVFELLVNHPRIKTDAHREEQK